MNSRRCCRAPTPVLIDVREADEQATGILAGASLIPLAMLPARVAETPGLRRAPIVVYCAGGTRSAAATQQLRSLGFDDVRSLRGGFTAWQRRGNPWVLPAGAARDGLEVEQRERYARHLRLPEVGAAGQRKLLEARVLCVGAGGLGSPASLYLAAAGIGTIGLVDDDKVELSNLQRQVVHTTGRIGMAKVTSAARTLESLNPGTTIVPIESRLVADNAPDLIAAYDLVIDGSDNLATRYLVNDTALRLGKPVVHGAVLRFEGHVGLFTGQPCYRCLFREAPPAELAPSCAEAGVLGVLPGVIGVCRRPRRSSGSSASARVCAAGC